MEEGREESDRGKRVKEKKGMIDGRNGGRRQGGRKRRKKEREEREGKGRKKKSRKE